MAGVGRAGVAWLLVAGLVAACADGESSLSDDDPAPGAASTPGEEPPRADLPAPLSLRDVDGRTIRATPFADFAVAAGDGIWVSGVAPGAVRYDARDGRVDARTRVSGEVAQALEATAGHVWIPTSTPELLRVDADSGRVVERTELPAAPLVEGVVGAVGDTAYVLVDAASPVILVVEGGRVSERIEAPDDARAVRAAGGSLWVPTGSDTVERYDLEAQQWTSIASGSGPRFLDAGFGGIWVMDQADGSVTHIDAATGEAEILPASDSFIGGGDLTTGAGAVWLRTDDAVLRIDPATGEVTHLLELPPGSGSVAASDDALWITNHDHLAVHRVPLPLP